MHLSGSYIHFEYRCKSSETTVFSLIFLKSSLALVTLKALDKVDQSVGDPGIIGKVHTVVVCLCSQSIELFAAQVGMYVANFPLKAFKILHRPYYGNPWLSCLNEAINSFGKTCCYMQEHHKL